jgi:hypothetical protein
MSAPTNNAIVQTLPAVAPYNEQLYANVKGYIETFNKTLDGVKKTHVEVVEWKKPSLYASIFSTAVGFGTAFAYNAGRKYLAYGLGAFAIVVLIQSGRNKKSVESPEFAKFSEQGNKIAQYLVNAFVSKATYMVDQAGISKNNWASIHDKSLASHYDCTDTSYAKSIESKKVSEDQLKWGRNHKSLLDLVALLPPDTVQISDQNLVAVFKKVSQARDLLVNGQSPVSDTKEEQTPTYIKYPIEKTEPVSAWPTAIEIAKRILSL